MAFPKKVRNPKNRAVPFRSVRVFRAKPCWIRVFSVPGISVPDLKFRAVPGRAITAIFDFNNRLEYLALGGLGNRETTCLPASPSDR